MAGATTFATLLKRWDYGCWAFESIYVYGGNGEEPYSRPYGRSPVVKVLGRKAAIIIAPEGRQHNPRPERPSNLRTLRPTGPVNLKNLSRSKDAELTFQ